MSQSLRLFLLANMVFIFFLSSPQAKEPDPASFYKGQQVKLVVGYPPSSGHSAYARLLAAHLPRHVPGEPSLIVQNMPGAGSMVAANWLYNIAPRDGSTIGIFAINVAIDSLFGNTAAKFDPHKFNWIGNITTTIAICGVWKDAGVRTFKELQQKEVLFGVTGPAGGTYQSAAALKNLFGAKIKMVRGYKAGEDILLAMERGEVQGRCGYPLEQVIDHIRSGDVIPLIHNGRGPVDDLRNVPRVFDFAKTEEERGIVDLVFGWHTLGRPVAAPPALPLERLRALQSAFAATMDDTQFLADTKRANLSVSWTSGPEVQTMVSRFLSHPREIVDKAAQVVRE